MRTLLIIALLFSLPVNSYGQKLPLVNVNHFYLVIDSADVDALQHSGFIKNKLAAFVTRTTKADSTAVWTGSYLEGLDNYFEIFNGKGFDEPVGNAGIAFSVDKVGEINQLDTILSKKYSTELRLREKQYDENKAVPWFTGLGIKDSAFDAATHISFWVMEYKPQYYDYNNWKYEDNKLTRLTYLKQYEEQRRNKILKRFTGITLRVTGKEKEVISGFLLNCGYHKTERGCFISPENFEISFKSRTVKDRYAIAAIRFESNMPMDETVKICGNIKVILHNKSGLITLQ